MKKLIILVLIILYWINISFALEWIWNMKCESIKELPNIYENEFKNIVLNNKKDINNFITKYNPYFLKKWKYTEIKNIILSTDKKTITFIWKKINNTFVIVKNWVESEEYIKIEKIVYSIFNRKDIKYTWTTKNRIKKVMMNSIYVWDDFDTKFFKFIWNDSFIKKSESGLDKNYVVFNYWQILTKKDDIKKFLEENKQYLKNNKLNYTEIKNINFSENKKILTFVWKKENKYTKQVNWRTYLFTDSNYIVVKNWVEWKKYSSISQVIYSPNWESIVFYWNENQLVLDNEELLYREADYINIEYSENELMVYGFLWNKWNKFFYWTDKTYPRTYYIIQDWTKKEIKNLSSDYYTHFSNSVSFKQSDDYMIALEMYITKSNNINEHTLIYNWEKIWLWKFFVDKLKYYWNNKIWIKLRNRENKEKNYICINNEKELENLKLKINKTIILKINNIISKINKKEDTKYKKNLINKVTKLEEKYKYNKKISNILKYFKYMLKN